MNDIPQGPTDSTSEYTLLSTIDPSEIQSLAQGVAATYGIGAGTPSEMLVADPSDPTQLTSGAEIRARCGPLGCDFAVMSDDGETFALTNCGEGTCPTCPPGLGNLVVRGWCAYIGIASGRAAIVFILMFGAKVGPIIV